MEAEDLAERAEEDIHEDIESMEWLRANREVKWAFSQFAWQFLDAWALDRIIELRRELKARKAREAVLS